MSSSQFDDPLDHYLGGIEAGRLDRGRNKLERARMERLLERFLPPAPATVHDVGGGAEAHALWLAAKGYAVSLLDPVALHVEQARAASRNTRHPLAAIEVGDARALPYKDGSADAVLLLGPLYHLVLADDRMRALREAYRVLKPGGVMLGASINRFVSTFNGLFDGLYSDQRFMEMADRDLDDGQHSPPPGRPWFTRAFFHHPQELQDEVGAAGFSVDAVIGIEGVPSLLADFDARWEDPVKRSWILKVAEALEQEPTLLGASTHLLAIGRRPQL